MTRYVHGSPVAARTVADRLLASSMLARKSGAFGFATVMLQGSVAVRELELENDRLRELLDQSEARRGLTP